MVFLARKISIIPEITAANAAKITALLLSPVL